MERGTSRLLLGLRVGLFLSHKPPESGALRGMIGPWRPGCMRAGVEAKNRELFSRAGLRRGDRDLPGFRFPCQM